MRLRSAALSLIAMGAACLPNYILVEDGNATSGTGGAGASSSAPASVSASMASVGSGGSTSSATVGGPGCGNGVKEGDETCDGQDGVPAACTDVLGPGATGMVKCSSHCQLDVSGCTAPAECGDTSGLQAGAAWPMEGGCPTRISRSRYVGPQTANVKWKQSICDAFGAHVMVAADGTLYTGCYNGKLLALDPMQGASKWTATSLVAVTNPVAIDSLGGNVHVGLLDKTFYVYTPAGAQKWAVTMSAATAGPAMLLPNGDSCFGGFDGTIYCLDESGNMHLSHVLDPTMGAMVGAVAPDGTLYAFSFDPGDALDGKLYALTPALTETWSTPIGPEPTMIVESTKGTLYVGDWDGNVQAIPPSGPPAAWVLPLGGRAAVEALAADGTLYARSGTPPPFHAIRPDGTVRWNFTTMDYVSGVVVGADGLIYVGTGGQDGNVYALDPIGGAPVWTLPVGVGRQEPNSIAADGTLYVTSSDGALRALGP